MEYDFKTVTLKAGPHSSRESGMCLMEAVAYISGERHTTFPECSDPSISALAAFINNRLDDNERTTLLLPFLWRIPGTRDKRYMEKRKRKLDDFVNNNKLNYLTGSENQFIIFSMNYDNATITTQAYRGIKLLDELISMTEIKEALPELVKEKTSNV